MAARPPNGGCLAGRCCTKILNQFDSKRRPFPPRGAARSATVSHLGRVICPRQVGPLAPPPTAAHPPGWRRGRLLATPRRCAPAGIPRGCGPAPGGPRACRANQAADQTSPADLVMLHLCPLEDRWLDSPVTRSCRLTASTHGDVRRPAPAAPACLHCPYAVWRGLAGLCSRRGLARRSGPKRIPAACQ